MSDRGFPPCPGHATLRRKEGETMPITTCIFDAYGTLFDVAAAARIAAEEPGREAFARNWPRIAQNWRLKQLQYTWLRAVMNRHCDFWEVTQDGLDWALEAEGLDGDAELRARLSAALLGTRGFSGSAKNAGGAQGDGPATPRSSRTARPKMLDGAVQSAGIGPLLDDVLSVESVGIFKPADAVYDLVCGRFGCVRDEVLFVSSNGWDAAAAAGYGFTTAWVNRAGEPVDRLPARPHHILSGPHRHPGARRLMAQLHHFRRAEPCITRTRATGPAVLCLAGLTRNAADFTYLAAASARRIG